MLTSVTGGVNYAAGEVVLETPEIAADLVQAGHAEYNGAPAATKSEKTTSKQAQQAEKR